QARRLAAQLVFGVMEVGQVLDLGEGQEAVLRGAEREAEEGLLVEQGVEDAGGRGALGEAARDAVDAALATDVLAEDQHLGVLREQLAERAVDRLRERARPFALGRRLAPQAPAR